MAYTTPCLDYQAGNKEAGALALLLSTLCLGIGAHAPEPRAAFVQVGLVLLAVLPGLALWEDARWLAPDAPALGGQVRFFLGSVAGLFGTLFGLALAVALVSDGGGCKGAIVPFLLMFAAGISWLTALLFLRTRGLAAWLFPLVLGVLAASSWL